MKTRIIGAILVLAVLAVCVVISNDMGSTTPSRPSGPAINNDVDFKNLKIN